MGRYRQRHHQASFYFGGLCGLGVFVFDGHDIKQFSHQMDGRKELAAPAQTRLRYSSASGGALLLDEVGQT